MRKNLTLGCVGALAGVLLLIIVSSVVHVNENGTGLVTRQVFGGNLPAGRIIAAGGTKGPQAEVLGPGWHFGYWPVVYRVQKSEIMSIEKGRCGLVEAMDGNPLPPGESFAPEWADPQQMLDATRFMGTGIKGPQLTVLTPGSYRLNPMLYKVSDCMALDVRIGEVAVIRSNVGVSATGAQVLSVVNGVPIVAKECKGVWSEPILPGLYYINTAAYVPTKISTAQRVYEYIETENKKLAAPIGVRSKDGFTFPVDVRVAVTVPAASAPYVVAALGDPDGKMKEGEDAGLISNLEGLLILPAIRATLRNIAEKKTAFEFVDTRSQVESETKQALIAAMAANKVIVDGLYIGKIDFDDNPAVKALMTTRTDREVAINQQKTYIEQEKAQQERAKLVKASELAEQQKPLIASQVDVDIQKQKALARAAEAEGEAKYIDVTFSARQKAYEGLAKSIGQDGVTVLEALKMVKEGNIQITPQVMITGSSSDGASSALMGTMLHKLVTEKGGKKE